MRKIRGAIHVGVFAWGHYLRSAGHKAALSQKQSGLLLYLSHGRSKKLLAHAHGKQERLERFDKRYGMNIRAEKTKNPFYLVPLSGGDA